MPKMSERTVTVNGPRLWSDRVKAAPTEEGFLELMGDEAVSLSTLQRAEKGRPIQYSKLKSIAKYIGGNVDLYVQERDLIVPRTTCDINGVWRGFYIEPNVDLEPQLLSQNLTIVHRGGQVSIDFSEVGSDGEDRIERVVTAYLIGDMLTVTSILQGWSQPSGFSTTKVKVQNGDEYLSGYTVWYDKDTEGIEQSKTAFAREGTLSFDRFLLRAETEVVDHAEAISGPGSVVGAIKNSVGRPEVKT